MSIYQKYQECINTNLNLQENEWYFKSDSNYIEILEHVNVD